MKELQPEATKRKRSFSRKSVEKIAAIIDVDVRSKEDREKLTNSLKLAAAQYRAHQGKPSKMPNSRIEEYLIRLRKAQSKVNDVVGKGVPYEVDIRLGIGFSERLMAATDTRRIDMALDDIKTGKSGRKADIPLIHFIASLSIIYNYWTGIPQSPDDPDRLTATKANFMQACLKNLGIDISIHKLRRYYLAD